ncbi:MAG TPA: hypothetical protein VIJ34_00470 [Acidimicrobiales bacterium]
MEELSGNSSADARLVVERMRALASRRTTSYPRQWTPQGTFDGLMEHADRDPIHFDQSLHHLHHHWDRGPALQQGAPGRSPKSILRRLLSRVIAGALGPYFAEEQDFRIALARSIDAIAYRVDEIASADERAILTLIRNDLLDLAKTVEARFEKLETTN